jgi:hypothetical protein
VLKIGAGTAARQQAVTLRAIAVLCLLPAIAEGIGHDEQPGRNAAGAH